MFTPRQSVRGRMRTRRIGPEGNTALGLAAILLGTGLAIVTGNAEWFILDGVGAIWMFGANQMRRK